MSFISIKPQRYRERLNKIIVAIIASLAVGSLAISQTLIFLFPSQAIGSEPASHFHWNLLGVISMAIIVFIVLRKLKVHPYFYEVSYVWDLKVRLNKINRYRQKIEAQANQGNHHAMQILHYSYVGSRQLWELDNNTLTINHLNKLEQQLKALADTHNITLDTQQFSLALLVDFA